MFRKYKRFFLLTFLFSTGFCLTKNVFADTVGKINFQDTEVFETPDLNSDIIKKMPCGQAVQILESEQNFYKIIFDCGDNKHEAYIKKNFIDVIETCGIVNADSVNVRVLPYKDAQIIAQIDFGTEINIQAIAGNWFVISFENKKAYIAKKFVTCDFENDLPKIDLPKHKFAIVTSNNGLNLRSGRSSATKAVCSLAFNSVLDVLDEDTNHDWIYVAHENNFGYVKSDYIKISDEKPKIEKEIRESKADQIIAFAKKFIGTPYRYAGRNLNKGVDCSGFVYCVMKNFGVNINSSSRTQVKNGTEVKKSELAKGDLVFFSNGGKKNIQHVGMYIGNNNFIHSASTRNKGVMISSLGENYYVKNYVTARRVI